MVPRCKFASHSGAIFGDFQNGSQNASDIDTTTEVVVICVKGEAPMFCVTSTLWSSSCLVMGWPCASIMSGKFEFATADEGAPSGQLGRLKLCLFVCMHNLYEGARTQSQNVLAHSLLCERCVRNFR